MKDDVANIFDTKLYKKKYWEPTTIGRPLKPTQPTMCENVKGAKNVVTYNMHQQMNCTTWHLHGHYFGGGLIYKGIYHKLWDKSNIWKWHRLFHQMGPS